MKSATVRRPIRELPAAELAAWLKQQGEPAFRLKQLRDWLFKHLSLSFAEMTSLGVGLRAALERDFSCLALSPAETLTAADGTRKFLLSLRDGESVETVLIPADRRRTVCVSTQVGCPVGCRFCATGASGFVRNLGTAEILDQIVFAARQADERLSHVVVMGMGEPLLNLDNLLPALELACSPEGLGLSCRHVTISTCGIVPGIARLAAAGRPWTLALSLHAVEDAKRARLIPAAHRWPLSEVLAACAEYRRQSSRMVTLEYALIAGFNDSEADLRELAAIATRLHAKVNLIPCNNTGTKEFRAPPAAGIAAAARLLEKLGAQATVRNSRGDDIAAACGQLRRRQFAGTPAGSNPCTPDAG